MTNDQWQMERRRLSAPFRKFDDVLQGLFRIWPRALEGDGSLAGGERTEPPVIIKHMNAPLPGRGEILQPLPGCASLFLFYPGVRFAHPRLSSIRPAGAEYVTVFMKRCSEEQPCWIKRNWQGSFSNCIAGHASSSCRMCGTRPARASSKPRDSQRWPRRAQAWPMRS